MKKKLLSILAVILIGGILLLTGSACELPSGAECNKKCDEICFVSSERGGELICISCTGILAGMCNGCAKICGISD